MEIGTEKGEEEEMELRRERKKRKRRNLEGERIGREKGKKG